MQFVDRIGGQSDAAVRFMVDWRRLYCSIAGIEI